MTNNFTQSASLRKHFALAFATALSLISIAGHAAFEPKKDLVVVNTSSAGGGSDVCIRTMMKVMTDLKISPVNWLVDYRVGGSGAKGYSWVAKKTGDDYLITKVAASFFTTPLLGESPVNYKDFVPVASVVEDPYVMVVSAKGKIKSLDDIKKSGSMLSGTTGVASDQALIAQQLKGSMGIAVDIIPYGGSGEVVSALLGKHIDVMFSNPSEAQTLIKAGEVLPLAVSSATRLPALPNVPSFKELGYNVNVTQLRAFVMPKGVSPEAVAYWANVIGKIVNSPNWKTEYIERYDVLPKYLTGEALAQEIQRKNDDYAKLMNSLGILKAKK